MNQYRWMVLAMCLICLYGWSEPQEGFSLAAGGMAHMAHDRFGDGPYRNYDSSGVALYGDAQFVVNQRWSLNPYLLLGLEKAHGDSAQNLGNSSGGLQLRHWWGNGYAGANINYSIEQMLKGGTVQSATFGPGVGLDAGYESPSGLVFGAGLDFPQVLYFNGTNHHSGVWVVLGYRWH